MMRNLSFLILPFLAASLILSSSSEKAEHSCEKELKLLRSTNDSLVQRLAEVQVMAEKQMLDAMEEQRLADINRREADMQRQVAERAQEEALLQAEGAILARDEAQKYRLLAEEYKKKLETCEDNQ